MKVPTEIVGIDFETYYDSKQYSLKRMTTTSYVRDPRFKIHGVAIQTRRQKKAKWYAGTTAVTALKKIDWKNTAMLAHNAHFEGLIMSHHLKIKPAYYYDTISMGRALYGMETRADLDTLAKHCGFEGKKEGYLTDADGVIDLSRKALKKLGDGAIRDAELMWMLFRHMLSEFPEPELDLIHHTVRCFAQPILKVNEAIAKKEHEKEVKRRRNIIRVVFMKKGERLTPDKFDKCLKKLRSRPTYAGMLKELGVDPPLKISKTTDKLTYAFAKNDLQFLELQEHPDERVRKLIEAKLIASSSIHETRPLRMIEHSKPALTIYLNYCGARNTQRWSGADKMNPQNLSRDSQLRNAIEAPPGYKLVVGDSAAIEARGNAWLAGQWDLIDQFEQFDKSVRKGAPNYRIEPYCAFASNVFGRPITKDDKVERFIGKVCILALGYQMGVTRYKFTLETGQMGERLVLAEEQYQEHVNTYRHQMWAIRDQWYFMQERLKDMLYPNCELVYRDCITFLHRAIMPPNEIPLTYPRLRQLENGDFVYKEETKMYGGKLVENIIQNLARTVVAYQLLPIAAHYRAVLMVHDEGVFAVPAKQAKKCAADFMDSLSTPPDWAPDLPVAGEVGIFDHYVKM